MDSNDILSRRLARAGVKQNDYSRFISLPRLVIPAATPSSTETPKEKK